MNRFAVLALIAVSVAANAQVGKQFPRVLPKLQVTKDTVTIHQFDFCLCDESTGGQIYRDGQTIPETALPSGFFELGISSLTGSDVSNVEYRIYSTTTNFDTGVKTLSSVTTAPGYTNPHATWAMLNGKHTFIAVVDPNRKLPESNAQRAKNTATLTITFNVVDKRNADPAAVGVPLNRILSGRLNDPSGVCNSSGPSSSYGSITMSLYYSGPHPQPSTVKPCTFIVEFFSGVQVGNGWVFDSVSLNDQGGYHDYTVQPTWEVYPSGTALYGRLNIHFTQVNTTPHQVTVRYLIKEPRGTKTTQPAYGVAR